MNNLFFIAEPLIKLLLFAGCFFWLGCVINRHIFKAEFGSANYLICSVLGICYTILISHLLLVFGVYYSWTVLLAILVPLVFLKPQKSAKLSLSSVAVWFNRHILFLLIVLIYFSPEMLRIFAPEQAHDAISYHLPYSRAFAESNGLVLNTYLRYPLNALNFDLMFSLGYLFEGELLARMFHAYSTFLLVVGTYVFSCLHFNKLTALLAVWGLCGIEMIASLMVAGYIDLGLSLFIFTSIMLLLSFQSKQQPRYLYLSALIFGVALGTKYLVLMLLPIYLGWVYISCQKKICFWRAMLVVILVGSPWYLRNLYVAGNPIHPFAQQLFGFWLWDAADLVAQKADLLMHHGVDRNLTQFIKLPYLFLTNVFNLDGRVNHMVALGVALLPLGLLVKGVIRQLAIFSLISLLLWFFTSQIARYLIYLFPFLLIIAAYFIAAVVFKIATLLPYDSANIVYRVKPFVLPLGMLALMGIGYKLVNYHSKLLSFDFIASDPDDWQHLLYKKPQYELVDAANQHAKKGTFVLAATPLQLYFDRKVMGDWYGSANMVEFAQNIKSKNDLLRQINFYQIDMILIERKQHIFGGFEKLLEQDFGLKAFKKNEFGSLFLFPDSKTPLSRGLLNP